MKRIAVLGSTGSIGTSCLDVIRQHANSMQLVAVAAGSSWKELAEQTQAFQPRRAALANSSLAESVDQSCFHDKTELRFGSDEVEAIAALDDVDTVVSAIVGAAGLRGTWAAVECGKRVAIANKETLVVAGPLIMDLARERGAELIPVDSEHSAVFQAMQSGPRSAVKRVVLTASGGPFRQSSAADMESVTPRTALAHPTWEMWPKISIDSATMMNKALEIIEARWLFGIEADQIEVVVHPQSILHSFVEFDDGSVIAQMSPPDMRLPIQYALTYPERTEAVCPRIDWTQAMTLELEPPDLERFPALELGFEVAARGGTAGVVLNAANEIAVERFLNSQLRFTDIARACRDILNQHNYDANPTLDGLMRLDKWAREETRSWKH
ncbi:MAG: 1-deoxy-D-xylulose-5-phosphate reductoisomerase [Planctomycetaceae bacterium]